MAEGRDAPPSGPRPWSVAWEQALRFWTRGPGLDGPAAHFRTSAHIGGALAPALLGLLRGIDARLGAPARLDVVDVGAGRGEVLAALLASADRTLVDRLHLVGIDLLPRPDGLDPRITWLQGAAPDVLPSEVRGLLLAHEWLDELPVDVVVADDDGTLRVVLVDDEGVETVGPPADEATAAWVRRWYAGLRPGDRAECGSARDDAWRSCVARVRAGTALAIDYGHVRPERDEGRWAAGTLTGYRDGASCSPRPDGSMDLTAHVAMDAVAEACGAEHRLERQRDALRALGVSARLPDPATASTDPPAYADALERASQASELLDPAGLGAFWWLRHDI